MRLVLASASPRRSELLRAAGLQFEVDPADTDESVHPGEDACHYAMRVARDKAETVGRRHPESWVIAADTIVVVDGDILGKPKDQADAARMLSRLSGREHEVLTAVTVRHGQAERSSVESTTVRVGRIDPATITWYVGTGEPLGKAGAYAIQGLASRFVTGIVGSYSNVVGLPVASVCTLLRELGWGGELSQAFSD